jgi:hypothetical protein
MTREQKIQAAIDALPRATGGDWWEACGKYLKKWVGGNNARERGANATLIAAAKDLAEEVVRLREEAQVLARDREISKLDVKPEDVVEVRIPGLSMKDVPRLAEMLEKRLPESVPACVLRKLVEEAVEDDPRATPEEAVRYHVGGDLARAAERPDFVEKWLEEIAQARESALAELVKGWTPEEISRRCHLDVHQGPPKVERVIVDGEAILEFRWPDIGSGLSGKFEIVDLRPAKASEGGT